MGTTIIHKETVNIFPQNLVSTKEELVEEVRQGLLDIGSNNVNTGLV